MLSRRSGPTSMRLDRVSALEQCVSYCQQGLGHRLFTGGATLKKSERLIDQLSLALKDFLLRQLSTAVTRSWRSLPFPLKDKALSPPGLGHACGSTQASAFPETQKPILAAVIARGP